jgi:prepilin-type N-terminal cleavage/methylation domain-containing protein/prepilin-type processing-associated H-X9-DG protein
MDRKKGFTLIELLVVISIIALLLSILLPALTKAREQAKRVVCVKNTKGLALAWHTYATENKGEIPYTCGWASDVATGDYNKPKEQKRNYGWIGWTGSTSDYPTWSIRDRIEWGVKRGALWPYCQNVGSYVCSSPKSGAGEVISYSMPAPINGNYYSTYYGNAVKEGCWVTKLAEIHRTAERIIFLCEGENAWNGDWGIYYPYAMWWDRPPIRHGEGIPLAFADAHAEFRKWENKDTVNYAKGRMPSNYQPKNTDLQKFQRGVFGRLGYVPQQ